MTTDAGVAQLVRAPAFQAGCREFESRLPLHCFLHEEHAGFRCEIKTAVALGWAIVAKTAIVLG
jgi:hypothetical protein